MGLLEKVRNDPQVKRYKKVWESETVARSVKDVGEFFERPDIVRRMIESEKHHDRPALAGIVIDLESLIVEQSMAGIERGEMQGWPSPTRRNQLIGVIIRIVMEAEGWKPTGKKGSLVGISKMFKRSERYAPVAAKTGLVCCLNCGSATFTQKVSLKSELAYEVTFGDDIRKDCLDRDDKTLEAKPYQCKKCRTPLTDERNTPLLEASDIKEWAKRNKKELLAARKRYAPQS